MDVLEGYTTGRWASNCYIAAARSGESAVVIDPGEEAGALVSSRLAELGLRAEAVLLTHGHLDHIWSAREVCDAASIPAFVHPADRWLLEDPALALGAPAGTFSIDIPTEIRDLSDGERLTFGGLEIDIRHTPGHTPGSCVFVTDGVVFSGDLIFAGSVGRTDFPRGSTEDLIESIRRVILPMDDAVTILSGHGPETTVGTERTTNPFVLAGADLPKLLGL